MRDLAFFVGRARGIGHQTEADDAEAEPVGRDGLVDRRHADDVGAEAAHHLDLSRGLEFRAVDPEIDAVARLDLSRFEDCGLELAHDAGRQVLVAAVDGPLSREARAQGLVVRALERRAPGEVDMIAEHEDLALGQVSVQGAGRVRQHDALGGERLREQYRLNHDVRLVPLVAVDPSGEDRDRETPDVAENELLGVPLQFAGDLGPQLAERQFDGIFDELGNLAEARAEHEAERGLPAHSVVVFERFVDRLNGGRRDCEIHVYPHSTSRSPPW